MNKVRCSENRQLEEDNYLLLRRESDVMCFVLCKHSDILKWVHTLNWITFFWRCVIWVKRSTTGFRSPLQLTLGPTSKPCLRVTTLGSSYRLKYGEMRALCTKFHNGRAHKNSGKWISDTQIVAYLAAGAIGTRTFRPFSLKWRQPAKVTEWLGF